MPELSLVLNGQSCACALAKVERASLYGFKKTVSLDEEGNPCTWARLARDGMTLIPSGGVASGYVSPDGLWRSKADLSPVDIEGNALEEAPSTFSAPVTLEETASLDLFYEHDIRLVYALSGVEGALREALEAGTIFTFPFSYRGGLVSDQAFLLQGHDETFWLLVGKRTRVQLFDYHAVVLPAGDDEDGESDEDLLSFDF